MDRSETKTQRTASPQGPPPPICRLPFAFSQCLPYLELPRLFAYLIPPQCGLSLNARITRNVDYPNVSPRVTFYSLKQVGLPKTTPKTPRNHLVLSRPNRVRIRLSPSSFPSLFSSLRRQLKACPLTTIQCV